MEERAWDFREVGRLPAPGDNTAMTTRRLEVGTRNYVVLMGLTSRLTGFVRALELEMDGTRP